MEIMLNSTYDGYFEFKNSKLKAATEKLFKAGKALASNYATIGKILIDVKENEIFKDDFKNFGEYVNEVLGISQSTAYGMMSVCTRFLLPETSKDSNTFFTRFADTALYALLPLKMTYDETLNFCEKNDINETTPVADIKRTVKAVVTHANDTDGETDKTINNKTDTVTSPIKGSPLYDIKENLAIIRPYIKGEISSENVYYNDDYYNAVASLYDACIKHFNW